MVAAVVDLVAACTAVEADSHLVVVIVAVVEVAVTEVDFEEAIAVGFEGEIVVDFVEGVEEGANLAGDYNFLYHLSSPFNKLRCCVVARQDLYRAGPG